jgi:predicted metal-binding membrane protein
VESRRVFLGVSAIVFAASATMTIAWCASMSAMGAMQMPGDWTMSMMWMRMAGRSWLGAGAQFVGMWVAMMVVMMLPSLTPMLWRYRESLGAANGKHVGWLTVLAGAGYFALWAVLGGIMFGLGSVLAGIAMERPVLARAVPMVVGVAVLIAGVLQHTSWKARQLAFCREARGHGHTLPVRTAAARRHGWCFGLHCAQSCAGLTAVALGIGFMDIRVMGVVGTAITVERLAPNGVRAARAIGFGIVALGSLVIARAAGVQ